MTPIIESIVGILFCIGIVLLLSFFGYILEKAFYHNETPEERERRKDLEKRQDEFTNTYDWPWYQQF